jgi:uncharacterized DUF497 family protein
VRFEWSDRRAAANRRKHEVLFDEAAAVFLDPLSVTGDDPDHSLDERRRLASRFRGVCKNRRVDSAGFSR